MAKSISLSDHNNKILYSKILKRGVVKIPSEESIDKAALEYAKKHSDAPDKETPDWIINDFKAGALWAIKQL